MSKTDLLESMINKKIESNPIDSPLNEKYIELAVGENKMIPYVKTNLTAEDIWKEFGTGLAFYPSQLVDLSRPEFLKYIGAQYE